MSYAAEVLYLDVRSLALFRIGLGWTILYNLAALWTHFGDFYGPYSIEPAAYFQTFFLNSFHWSFHALGSDKGFVGFLFLLNAFFALMLIFGWRTRWAAFLCWLFAISLRNRVPGISFGGDQALITFLTWAMFLPLGAAWSMDAKAMPHEDRAGKVVSIASAGLVLQLAAIYLISGWGKTDAVWIKNHAALFYAFQDDRFSKTFGQWLVHFPLFLNVLTVLVLFLERVAILFLFMPFRVSLWRTALIIAFLLFHIGIDATMDVGWFSLIMLVGWTALIPAQWWRSLMFEDLGKASVNRRGWEAGAALLLAVILVWDVYKIQNEVFNSHLKIPPALQMVDRMGLICQGWIMFGPAPDPVIREYKIVPLFDGPLNPAARSEFNPLGGFRWVKLFSRLQDPQYRRYVPLLKSYWVHRWNVAHPQGPQVEEAVITFKDKKIGDF